MKSIMLEQPGRFHMNEVAPPREIAADEALVRVHRVGVCGTDLHAFEGVQPFFSYPRVLGHELSVEVIEVGGNEGGIARGDLCSVEPYINCGECIACINGKLNCCARMRVMGVHIDGGMQDYVRVPTRKLHKANHLSLEQLALVEPLSIGAHAVARAQIVSGEFALVIGAGPIGLAVTQFALASGARIIMMDTNTGRLNFCREHFAIERALDATADEDQTLALLQEITDGHLPTVVFDATGNRASMMRAFAKVAHGGRLIFVGIFQGEVTFSDPDFHWREITLLASRNALGADFRRVIALMESSQIAIDAWISHRVPAAQLIKQFPAWLDPQTKFIKALVEF